MVLVVVEGGVRMAAVSSALRATKRLPSFMVGYFLGDCVAKEM